MGVFTKVNTIMMLQLWHCVVLLVVSFTTVYADLSIPGGHAHKFVVPQDDIDDMVHLEKVKEKAEFSEISSRIYEDVINEALHKLTEQLDPIHLPFLPTITVNRTQPNVNIALTLTDLSLNGLSNLTVTHIETGLDGIFIPSLKPRINATLPRLSIDAGQYSSGGVIINLPFNGEGNLTIAFIGLDIVLGFELQSRLHPCAVAGSSLVVLELGHMVVDFEGMNPGTDQGEVINTVLGSFGPDIIDAIEAQLMTGPGHEAFDKVFINAINSAVTDNVPMVTCPHEKLWEN
ncbi:unnamed protein product [Meganyctiphanes norvegica]|uniref:Uncharacterized protein n=1 Tax=Meganyctiphanes norvegica TaxID=48144 RepID=A0AAV2QLA4_MEGNR